MRGFLEHHPECPRRVAGGVRLSREERNTPMKALSSGLLAISFLFVVSDRALAKCGGNVGDNAAVAAARAEVDATCNCATAPNHGTYVKCAKGIAKARTDTLLLPK